ncbi:MAG: ATP-binding protein [Steroidobacteraceae bacterium]|jgi:nitrogen fixation/metabolism regulation signal transduction histidine kinase
MDTRTLRLWLVRALVALGIGAGGGALLLLERSVENSAEFSRWQPSILVCGVLAVLALAVLLARQLWRLYSDFRHHVPGSRLTARTVTMFGGLVIAPLLIVYLFSLEFINHGIDSWFRVEIKQGLNDALVLSRSALDLRLREQARRTESFARAVASLRGVELQTRMDAERRAAEAADIIIYDVSGRPLAISSAAMSAQLPGPPSAEVMLQIASGQNYVSKELEPNGRYAITTASPIPTRPGEAERRYVLIDYDAPEALSALGEAVQRAYSNYGSTAAEREPLKETFGLTLTLVLLVTMLAAIYGAVFSAQRLTRPVQDLIAGTRAVGKGDFGTRLPLPSRDEMGFLVHSFNDMTKRLRRASEEAAMSRQAVERERERLEVILSRLSSGVLVIDSQLNVRSANQAASAILGAEFPDEGATLLPPLTAEHSRLAQFSAALRERFAVGRREWREQLNLGGEGGGVVLLWACTALPDEDERGGLVIVFDDITALLTAQRSAAWGEVARRLAHEIKNPLTPIQLSAERLRRKLLGGLNAENAQLLERATHTIVQQVDAMKQMVNAFSDYARTPDMQFSRFSLNLLVGEVAELYRLRDPAIEIALDLEARVPDIEADRGRLRQILANLISNGIEALSATSGGRVQVATRLLDATGPGRGAEQIQLIVSDNGPGFREDILGQAFEPYVTSKARGTGLGLAIVKRIVEEHGGQITAENIPGGGARVSVVLPAIAERRTELRRERA